MYMDLAGGDPGGIGGFAPQSDAGPPGSAGGIRNETLDAVERGHHPVLPDPGGAAIALQHLPGSGGDVDGYALEDAGGPGGKRAGQGERR
jgi:hypothetical protein